MTLEKSSKDDNSSKKEDQSGKGEPKADKPTKKSDCAFLGVPETATAAEIRSAYKKLTLKYHPDKHGGDDAQMKELNLAYERLQKNQY